MVLAINKRLCFKLQIHVLLICSYTWHRQVLHSL